MTPIFSMDTGDGLTDFVELTQSALRQLYDSAILGTHPLARYVVTDRAGVVDRAQVLRRLILDCIAAQKPPPGVPTDSTDWRAYRLLELRYIDALSPDEAMAQLALQKSQFFRDQAKATRLVADCLRDKLGLSVANDRAKGSVTMDREAHRLVENVSWQTVDLAALLRSMEPLLRSLVEDANARLVLGTEDEVLLERASRVPVRQAVLNAASYALGLGRAFELTLRTATSKGRRGIEVVVGLLDDRELDLTSEAQETRWRLCEQLMAAMGGESTAVRYGGEHFLVRLAWPTRQTRTLLVIDDNQGFVDLYRRYLSGHIWQVSGASDGQEAREAIARGRPDVILLDVLMPREDGWDLLTSLKGDGATRDIPIVVCSVLKEAQLALSLGAAAYLPKPVTEASLLTALQPWSKPSATREPERSDWPPRLAPAH